MKIYNSKNPVDVIDLALKRPEMFLSDTSLTAFQDFLSGYMFGIGNQIDVEGLDTWNKFLYELTNKPNHEKINIKELFESVPTSERFVLLKDKWNEYRLNKGI